MKLQTIKDSIGWGFLLWFIGYLLGIVLFVVVSTDMIGWVLSPVATLFTLWVLIKKIKSKQFAYYVMIGIVWTIIAIIFDYVFIVTLFKSTSYYKLDVYVYYVIMFMLPVVVGMKKAKHIT